MRGMKNGRGYGKLTTMAKRPKLEDRDFSVLARHVVEQAIGEKLDGTPLDDPNAGKNPNAVALGRLGGLKGGAARTANLTKAQLKQIGRKGAEARWGKKKKA